MDICQSCGMPMENEELHGRNKDSSLNTDYCIYCYPNGEFHNPNEIFEEMVETCVPFLMKEGFAEDKARQHLMKKLKTLKRWAK